MFRTYKINRRDAEPMEDLMKLFLKRTGLAFGMNCQLVFNAWDKVSGAGRYTSRKFYKDGVLWCTISSSVVRNQLYFQKDAILLELNKALKEEKLFDLSKGLVSSIVLR